MEKGQFTEDEILQRVGVMYQEVKRKRAE